MGKSRLFGESAACRENARILGCVKTSVNYVAKQVLFLAAFVFLYAGAWAQSSTTIASASGDALHLAVRNRSFNCAVRLRGLRGLRRLRRLRPLGDRPQQ